MKKSREDKLRNKFKARQTVTNMKNYCPHDPLSSGWAWIHWGKEPQKQDIEKLAKKLS